MMAANRIQNPAFAAVAREPADVACMCFTPEFWREYSTDSEASVRLVFSAARLTAMAAAPYRKPDFLTLKVLQPLLLALGVTPSLTVRGRTSGRPYRFPVLLLDYQGRRYVVAPRGNTQWARNLRATGEADLKTGGRTSRMKATEIVPSQRKPLVDAYVQRYGTKYGGFVAKEFAAMPNPEHHPVFLLEDL